eukprot:TRINITY_DN9893_c0_g1_i1.p1 TRINITY_DN9893_c0_g1~~TRINITY_DN9893_c0_g1_i1.p1  ORF type:complete len:257 (-),score=25.26 TRINITY_DN9893_c0_g1_i1:128-898(-)
MSLQYVPLTQLPGQGAAKFCAKCGNAYAPAASFCMVCGAPRQHVPEVPVQMAAPPPAKAPPGPKMQKCGVKGCTNAAVNKCEGASCAAGCGKKLCLDHSDLVSVRTGDSWDRRVMCKQCSESYRTFQCGALVAGLFLAMVGLIAVSMSRVSSSSPSPSPFPSPTPPPTYWPPIDPSDSRVCCCMPPWRPSYSDLAFCMGENKLLPKGQSCPEAQKPMILGSPCEGICSFFQKCPDAPGSENTTNASASTENKTVVT